MYPPKPPMSHEGFMSIGGSDDELDLGPPVGSMGGDDELDLGPPVNSAPSGPAKPYTPGGINEMLMKESQPEAPDDRSMARKVGDWAFTPMLEAPARWGKEAADYFSDQPTQLWQAPTGEGGLSDWLKIKAAQGAGFGAGALEGIGQVITNFTTPADVAALAASGGAWGAGKAATKAGMSVRSALTAAEAAEAATKASKIASVADKFNTAGRAISTLPAAHGTLNVGRGGYNVLRPSATGEERWEGLKTVGSGLAEAAGGYLGMKGVPKVDPLGRTPHRWSASEEFLGPEVSEAMGEAFPHTRGGDVEFSELIDPDTGQPLRTTPVSESVAQDIPVVHRPYTEADYLTDEAHQKARQPREPETSIRDIEEEGGLTSEELWGPDEVTRIADPNKLSDALADDMFAKRQRRLAAEADVTRIMPDDEATNILREVEPESAFIPEPETMPGGVEPPTGAQFSRSVPENVAHDMSEGPIMPDDEASAILRRENTKLKSMQDNIVLREEVSNVRRADELTEEANWNEYVKSLREGYNKRNTADKNLTYEQWVDKYHNEADFDIGQDFDEPLPPAQEWKPSTNEPEMPTSEIDLNEVANLGNEMIESRGPNYVRDVLRTGGTGNPGLSSELRGNDLHVVYRDAEGNPIGAAKVVMDKKGDWQVADIAVEPNKGLSTSSGRAALAMGKELKKIGVKGSSTGLTPQGKRFMNRIMEANEMAENTPVLPRDLKGASPRFAYGPDQYTPRFESDLDKALFIISQKKPSLRDVDYLDFVMEHTGLDEAAARQAGREVRAAIKVAVKGQKPGEVTIPTTYGAKPVPPEIMAAPTGPPIKPPVKPPVTTGPPEMPPTPKGQKHVQIENVSPMQIKQMIEGGYDFQGIDKNGKAHFEFTGKPGKAPMLEEEIPQRMAKKEPKDPEEISKIKQALDLPVALMSVDAPFATSAAFRQAGPQMWTKHWFDAWGKAAKAYGSEWAKSWADDSLQKHALMQARPPTRKGGKPQPSFAEEAGVRFTDVTKVRSARQQKVISKLAEKIPFYGRHISGSNKAFAAFLNHIRIKLLEDFVKNGEVMARAHGDPTLNLKQNIPLAKEFGELINDTTGAGSLRTGIGSHELNLERHVDRIATAFFSPRLMARNIRMLNPNTYVMAHPEVRKKYMWAMMRSMGSWMALAGAVKASGLGDVETDPRSTDFGKIQIGNTRFDPGQGFQQYIVLAARQLAGSSTSSISDKNYPYGRSGVGAQTRMSGVEEFLSNKFNPLAKLGYDILSASTREPVYGGDRVLQMALPMVTGDVAELAAEDPALAGAVGLWSSVGGGAQTYTGATKGPQFFPDWGYDKFEGGGPF